MRSCARDTLWIITLLILILGGFIPVFGIVFVATSCNSKYKDCTNKMTKVKLVGISDFSCGYLCEHPKYDFAYVGHHGMCSVIDGTVTNTNITPEIQIYMYNETYYVYPYTGYGMTLCDLNQGRENYLSNVGICLICASVPILILSTIYQIWCCAR